MGLQSPGALGDDRCVHRGPVGGGQLGQPQLESASALAIHRPQLVRHRLHLGPAARDRPRDRTLLDEQLVQREIARRVGAQHAHADGTRGRRAGRVAAEEEPGHRTQLAQVAGKDELPLRQSPKWWQAALEQRSEIVGLRHGHGNGRPIVRCAGACGRRHLPDGAFGRYPRPGVHQPPARVASQADRQRNEDAGRARWPRRRLQALGELADEGSQRCGRDGPCGAIFVVVVAVSLGQASVRGGHLPPVFSDRCGAQRVCNASLYSQAWAALLFTVARSRREETVAGAAHQTETAIH